MTRYLTDAAGTSTLVYDGECALCRRWVTRIARRAQRGAIEFVASQSDGLFERFPQLAADDLSSGLRLITANGKVHVGADAVYQIARRLGFWRNLAWLYELPVVHGCARGAYALIAANRRRLGRDCTEGKCGVP